MRATSYIYLAYYLESSEIARGSIGPDESAEAAEDANVLQEHDASPLEAALLQREADELRELKQDEQGEPWWEDAS